MIGEVGKLAVRHAEQGFLKDFILEFLNFSTNELKVKTGFGSCTLVIERFYKQFGFYRVEGSNPFIYTDLPESVILRSDP